MTLPSPIHLFLKGMFFLLPVVGTAIPYGLPLWLCSTAFIAVGLCIFFRDHQKLSLPAPLLLAAIVILFLWMGISTFWAPSFWGSLKLFTSLITLAVAGTFLFSLLQSFEIKTLWSFLPPLLWGLVVALIFLLLDIIFKGSLRYALKTGTISVIGKYNNLIPYNQGATFLAIMLWPVSGLVYRFKRIFAILLLTSIPLLLAQLDCHAAIVSIGVGAFTFAGVYLFRRPALLAGAALVFLTMTASPHLVITFLDPLKIEEALPEKAKASYSHRLWIWRYVAHRSFERPLKGWGLDASRDKGFKQSMLWHSEKFCLDEGLKGDSDNCANESLPLHPHNMALQLWLELGVIGSILAGILLALFPALLAYLPVSRFAKSLSAATYASSLLIGFVAYGVWQNWWVSTLLINLALIGCLLKVEFQPSEE